MSRLLKLEFRKLFQQASFYICLVVMLALKAMDIGIGKLSAGAVGTGVMDGYTFGRGLLLPGTYSILLAVFLGIFICEDFSYDTMKNVVSKGYNRTTIFIAKYVVSLFVSAIFLVVGILGGFAGEAIVWGGYSIPVDYFVGILILQLFSMLVYQTLFISISMIFHKLSITILFGIIVPLLYTGVLSMLAFVVKGDWVHKLSVEQQLGTISSLGKKFTMTSIVEPVGIAILFVAALAVVGIVFSRRNEY